MSVHQFNAKLKGCMFTHPFLPLRPLLASPLLDHHLDPFLAVLLNDIAALSAEDGYCGVEEEVTVVAGEVAADTASLLWLSTLNSCQMNSTVTEPDVLHPARWAGGREAGHLAHRDWGSSHRIAGGSRARHLASGCGVAGHLVHGDGGASHHPAQGGGGAFHLSTGGRWAGHLVHGNGGACHPNAGD